jgi:diguanylate cyclase (GGDEF)-like protein/PAS domain S-box-containing protein
MSVNTPTPIRLLILSHSADQSQLITTSLRNGGLAVHGTRFTDLDKLDKQLESYPCDIALYCLEDLSHLRSVLETIGETGNDLPLLLLSKQETAAAEALQAMRHGARDNVSMHSLEHLQLVVAREFESLRQRRQLKTLQRRLKETEQRCKGLIESSREAIAFMQDGMHLHANPAYLETFGYAEFDDIEDIPLLDMIDKSHHAELKLTLRRLDNDSGQQSVTINTLFRQQTGETFKGSMYISKARMDGEPCLQIIARKIDRSAEEMEQALQKISYIDADSQLPNRQYFVTQLDVWAVDAENSQEPRALLYLSIDDFSELRSLLGIQHTDALIKSMADLLKSQVLEHDVLARFNDNTFTLLCRRSSTAIIHSFADELRRHIATLPLPEDSGKTNPTCSIGIVFLSGPAADASALINTVYTACETARRQGGNRLTLASSSTTQRNAIDPHDLRVLGQITDALDNNRFVLAYQPIVSLQGDSRENYAVLVRMLGEADEELLPEQFMQQAERHNKMIDIDRWVIRHAIASLAEQRKQGRKVNFFVNLSAQALLEKNLLLWIFDCLREFDARGGWLTFQIREKHVRDNLRQVTKLIEGLKKIKCQIALDHFGLLAEPDALLNHIKVDFVKLAPNLVSDINSNQEKQDELNNLNEVIIASGVKTIATAVEDANSLTVLWTIGIGYIQGYFLQEPSRTIEYGSSYLAP